MPRNVSNTATFINRDGSFELGELLKYVQENGSDPLWAEPEDSFEDIIKFVRKVDWGKEIHYSFCTDPGGGAMAGKAMQYGRFAPAHPTKNIKGRVNPKHQTVTYAFDNFTGDITKGNVNAYMNSIQQEMDSKNSIQKSSLMLQMLGDGTGRQATPAGFGPSNTSSGASFVVASNTQPLRVKISTLAAAAGSVAWFVEGSVISFAYVDRDLNNDGTNEVTAANGRVRLLGIKYTAASAETVTYDAFSVQAIHQSQDYVELLPCRILSADPTKDSDFIQIPNEWVTGTGPYTVSLVRGRSAGGIPAATDTVFGLPLADISLFIGAALDDQYQTMIHPGYLNPTQAQAKEQLGIGWTSATNIDLLSAYVPTGLHALLCDREHVLHGISRSSVLMNLPTYISQGGGELTFNTFLAALTEHSTRNRGKMADFSVMLMSPLVSASLIALSESNRIVMDREDVRGRKNRKIIQLGDKTFVFEDSSCMRKDKIYCINDGSPKMYDGQLRPVSIGGVSAFPLLIDGERRDATVKHANVTCEMVLKNARTNMVIDDFKVTALN